MPGRKSMAKSPMHQHAILIYIWRLQQTVPSLINLPNWWRLLNAVVSPPTHWEKRLILLWSVVKGIKQISERVTSSIVVLPMPRLLLLIVFLTMKKDRHSWSCYNASVIRKCGFGWLIPFVPIRVTLFQFNILFTFAADLPCELKK